MKLRMRVNEYVKSYTLGKRIPFHDVWTEIKELIVEVLKFNKAGMDEEFQDVLHFLQLWLFWKFGLNGELWKATSGSVNKFMRRKEIWMRIYRYVGLDEQISNYVGNYRRLHKVKGHLSKFRVSAEKAEEAYNEIVMKTFIVVND